MNKNKTAVNNAKNASKKLAMIRNNSFVSNNIKVYNLCRLNSLLHAFVFNIDIEECSADFCGNDFFDIIILIINSAAEKDINEKILKLVVEKQLYREKCEEKIDCFGSFDATLDILPHTINIHCPKSVSLSKLR